ncbi:hypothetical protein BKA67DRAFT_656600 [Truncatella angustata]|uniref:Uncharacterized protein n=1 Tax=Truncatella angustata TaxID=152316 RepID=A0A9P8UTV4_9PEZI|nr:uncharacterized protein BKA67DRAFT_656600 [Truncatella angustata]KAH6658407.1 hypothetical protein BKA67DRAFT_656600 [Truncatella angustata]KAH8194703.1 hypothetical protein TruAng_011137 [Truncatella angustata]
MAENNPRISTSDFKPPANFGSMSEQEQKQTYLEWAKDKYNEQYESWMPWIEDHFLKYFTNDNKASYATKQQLDKTKVTGIEQVDTLQDGVHGLVAGQVGQGGLLQPIGDFASKEGVNRAERQGKDDTGGYLPSGVTNNPVTNTVSSGLGSVAGGLGLGGGNKQQQ